MPRKRARRRQALRFRPLAPDLWNDLETLFGPRGACAGCWCMWWRIPRSAWQKGQGGANRRAFRRLVRDGGARGVLAYAGDRPAGWCAIGPRGDFPGLDRSRVLAPIDDAEVWSITCLFILPEFRRAGISGKLIAEAVRYARRGGARVVEGYPIDPDGEYPPAFAGTGIASAYLRAGFREAARRSPTRPIMRRRLRGTRRPRTGTS